MLKKMKGILGLFVLPILVCALAVVGAATVLVGIIKPDGESRLRTAVFMSLLTASLFIINYALDSWIDAAWDAHFDSDDEDLED